MKQQSKAVRGAKAAFSQAMSILGVEMGRVGGKARAKALSMEEKQRLGRLGGQAAKRREKAGFGSQGVKGW